MTPRQRRLVENLPVLIAVTTLGVTALLAVLGLGTATAVTAVVGWFLLTPLSAVVNEEILDLDSGGSDERTAGSPRPPADATPADPIDRLRERYADGDIDETEFERRLDLLLDTEGADAETARERN